MNKLSKWLQLIAVLFLTAFILWLSFKDIDAQGWQTIKIAFKSIRWQWILLSIVFALLSHLSRSIRWKMMLDTLGRPTQLLNAFLATMAGYFINLLLPRAGEAVRAGIISRKEQIRIDKVVGTIVNDRAIDVIILLGLTTLSFFIEAKVIGNYALNIFDVVWQKILGINFWLLTALTVVFVLVLFFIAKRFTVFFEKIKQVSQNIFTGILSIKRVGNPILFIFHSLFIWFMYFAMLYVCFQALPFTEHLSWQVGLVLFAFGTWGFVLTPGGIGAYPLVVSTILLLYNIPQAEGLAFGWIIWLVQTILNILVGGLSLFLVQVVGNK